MFGDERLKLEVNVTPLLSTRLSDEPQVPPHLSHTQLPLIFPPLGEQLVGYEDEKVVWDAWKGRVVLGGGDVGE